MKKKFIFGAIAIALPILALPTFAAEYPFPVDMKITIERGEDPMLKSSSSVVFPIISRFSVTMPNGDAAFVLENESGDELKMVKDGEEYLLQDPVHVGESIYFGADSQTAGKPVRVVLKEPINLGHIHFASGSSKLSSEAKWVISEMAQQMYNSSLFGAYLVGMTDRSGSDEANLSLSQKRVEVATKYLSKKLGLLGVTNAVLKTENMGEYLSPNKDGSTVPFDRKVSVLVYPVI